MHNEHLFTDKIIILQRTKQYVTVNYNLHVMIA